MSDYDIIIANARIVEGTDNAPYYGSIGIKGDKIAALGDVQGDSPRVIDAEGLLALPGFIDAHSHADLTVLMYPQCESYVMQGVTTFIGGQCGVSMAPMGGLIQQLPPWLRAHLQQLEPHKYYPNTPVGCGGTPFYSPEQIDEWMERIHGWKIDWSTMGGFFQKVEEEDVSMNLASLVGHGTIRASVMGVDYKRHATSGELARIREHIHQAMDDGCIGLSTGLDYDPDVFASQDEIVDGVSVLSEYGGIYCPHWRRTGRRRGVGQGHARNEKITAQMECVDVHKRTGVRLHFAHLQTGWDIFPNPTEELEAANVKATLDMIAGDSDVLDITWDAIPRLVRGSFEIMPYLCSLLTPWLRELGSREALGRWLKVADFREEVKEAIRSGKWFIRLSYNPNTNPRWAENIHVLKSKVPGVEGKSVAEIAKDRQANPWETYLDLISEDPDTQAVAESSPSMDAHKLFYTNPRGMVGTDNTGVYDDMKHVKKPPCVNTYSAYPSFYIKYVRESGIFNIEEAVQKTSVMVAKVHNLVGRGILKEGFYADIVLIDLDRLEVLGDALEPRRYPRGIQHVIVNGKPVVEEGRHTGTRPGRVLRRAT